MTGFENVCVRRPARLVCVLTALLVGANQLAAAETSPALESLTTATLDAQSDWDYRLDGTGQLWLAYYDEGRLLRLRDPQGKERLLVPEGRGQAPSGLAMAARQTAVDLLWRDKIPDKGLYLLDSHASDKAPQDVGGDSAPLARFEATASGDLLHLLWYGEQGDAATGEQYHLYYRNWNARTQALSPVASLMPGIYPVMSVGAAGDVMAYSWLTPANQSEQKDGNTKRIVARYRAADAAIDAAAVGFAEPVTVADVPEITPIFKAFKSGSRWFVMWVAQYGNDHREFLLEGAHSDDQGKTWQRFAFEALRGLDVASVNVATNDGGQIVMTLAGRLHADDASPKLDVLVIRSSDRGETWSTAERLRHIASKDANAAEQKTPDLTGFHARNPSVAFGKEPGQVLVVWEDWRTIRPALRASLSNDDGQTWTLNDVPLPHAVGKNLGLSYAINSVYAADKGFQVIAELSTDDSFDSKQLVRINLTASDLAEYAQLAKSAQPIDTKATEAALRKRAEGFWKSLVEAEYAENYAYQDPFFRAQMSSQSYLSKMGRIKYTFAEVEKVRVDGPIAKVETKIHASIPPFKAPKTGETLSQPERQVTVTNTWVQVDGEWYNEFRNQSEETVFTRY